MFNEATKNISVQSDDAGVSMKVIDEDRVDITTKKTSLKALKKNHTIQYGNFLKTSTLLQDGKLVTENIDEPRIADTLEQKITHTQMTDEELFQACGGRTAHKGARHGLNLNGKLARIAEQERQLMAKMSLAKSDSGGANIEPISSVSELHNDFETVKSRKRMKSKRKMMKTDPESETNASEATSGTLVNTKDPKPSCSYSIDPDAEANLEALKSKRKTKKSKESNSETSKALKDIEDCSKLGFGRRGGESEVDDNANTIAEPDMEELAILPISKEPRHRVKSKKGRKKEKRRINDLTARMDVACVIDESMKSSKKRRREEGQQIVGEILNDALEECGPSIGKCKKSNLDESYNRNAYEADKLNAKILKKKKHAHNKKRKDKVDGLTEEFMSVNLDEENNKASNSVTEYKAQSTSRKCDRHKST